MNHKLPYSLRHIHQQNHTYHGPEEITNFLGYKLAIVNNPWRYGKNGWDLRLLETAVWQKCLDSQCQARLRNIFQQEVSSMVGW